MDNFSINLLMLSQWLTIGLLWMQNKHHESWPKEMLSLKISSWILTVRNTLLIIFLLYLLIALEQSAQIVQNAPNSANNDLIRLSIIIIEYLCKWKLSLSLALMIAVDIKSFYFKINLSIFENYFLTLSNGMFYHF